MDFKNIAFSTKSGFTLIEVLVSLLIFSIGLIGMAGLVVMSVKTNHTAYLRTQATFLAEGMAERMRVNRLGVWNNSYQATIAASATVSPPALCTTTGAGCNSAAVATIDVQTFTNQLATFLPRPTTSGTPFAAIGCTRTGTYAVTDFTILPPYDGVCTITINWHEQTNSATADQTLRWVFQP